MDNQKLPDRKTYIDFLKIFAIYLVLFNHTGTKGFVLFTIRQDSILYPLYLFNSIFIKVAVPLFFMASGALLLGKEESYRDLLVKRFLKYLFILFAASAIAYLYNCLRLKTQELSLTKFLKEIYTFRLTTAYWYLYAYLAYILMLPLIRKMAKAMANRDFQWMILMFGAIQSLSVIDFIIWKGEASHNGFFSFFITTNYVFYPLAGYYIDKRLDKDAFSRRNLLLLTASSIMAIAICSFMTHYQCTLSGDWTEDHCQTFYNTLIFLPTITIFFAAKMWFMKHNPSCRVHKFITAAGGTTFGIFLIEAICRNETMPIFIWLNPLLHSLPACWIWIFTACICGGIFIWGLKHIPGISKFL